MRAVGVECASKPRSSPLVAGHVEVDAQRPPDVAGSTPSSIAWAAVRPSKPVSTWSTSTDAPYAAPNRRTTRSLNSVSRTPANIPTPVTRPEPALRGTPAPGRPRGRCWRRPSGRPPGSGATTAPRSTAATSASAVNGRISRALPWRTTRLAISHWSPPPGTTTSGTPASSVLATMPWPPPQITTSACVNSSAWRPSPTTAHGGTVRSAPPSRDTTRRDPAGSVSPGVRQPSATSARPSVPVNAVDGATTTTGPEPAGTSKHPIGRLEVQRAHQDGLGRPVRTRNLQRGQRGDQPSQRPGIAAPAARSRRRTAARCCRPDAPGPRCQRPHRGIAQPAADAGARRQPAAYRRQPLRRQVQRMRVELYPRDAQQLGSHAAAGGDDVGHHQVGCQLAQRRHVEHGHPRRTPVDSGPGVDVVVGGREPVQRDSVDAGGAGGVDPFLAGEQRGLVAGFAESSAQRNRGKRVPGIRPGDHGDAHPPYPATARGRTRLRWQP